MAQATKCTICKRFDFRTGCCSVYKSKPPKDIFLEYQDCQDYERKPPVDLGNIDLPIAKGK